MTEDAKTIENEITTIGEKANIDPALLDEVVKAGILYGRKKTKTHPRMREYIYTTRNGIEIIDVARTLLLIDAASDFLRNTVRTGGSLLFIGTTPAAKETIANIAQQTAFPYVTERWLGGTLTNFKTIYQRLQYYLKLKSDLAAGRLEKYTKKERVGFSKEIVRMDILFGGLELLNKLPQAIVVAGAGANETAVREALKLHIPIVSLISTDSDPDLIDYPIPCNDRAKSSITWVFNRLEKAVLEGKEELKKVATSVVK